MQKSRPWFWFCLFFSKVQKVYFFSSFAIESENNNHCVLKKPSKIAYFVDWNYISWRRDSDERSSFEPFLKGLDSQSVVVFFCSIFSNIHLKHLWCYHSKLFGGSQGRRRYLTIPCRQNGHVLTCPFNVSIS